MATQWHEYVGDNHENNRVIVDYRKQRVFFQPVLRVPLWKTLVQVGVLIFCNWFIALLLFFLVPLVLTGGLFGLLGNEVFFAIIQEAVNFFVRYVWIVPALSFIFFVAFRWRNKKWRSEKYPEWNHVMLSMSKRMLLFGTYKDEWHIVRKEAVRHREFIIPSFGNVLLDYKATGDFAKYLNRITIDNLYHKNDGEWCAVFRFSKTPVNGTLRLRYD